MYHTLIEKAFDETKDLCEKIISYIHHNEDEIYLIQRTISSMSAALRQKNYFTLYSSVSHLSEDLRPWHNVPSATLESLEKRIFDLGTAIKVQYGDNWSMRKVITNLQLNRIKRLVENKKSKHVETILNHLSENDPDLRQPIRKLQEEIKN